MKTIALIDLSSIIHPIYHMTGTDPNPDAASNAAVARVHALATGHDHVAVCCESGRSIRKEIDPAYKANRPERDEILKHQIGLAIDQLKRDGFPCWSVDGYEADDVIATATMRALAIDAETEVLIVTGDKDLLQLVGPRVKAKSVQTGDVRGEEGVFERFKVRPDQILDYLTLVGDSSDNIKGVPGVGGVKAADLLTRFQSLDQLYAGLDRDGAATMQIQPATAKALAEFRPNLERTRKLIALETGLDIPFDDLLKPRVSEAAVAFEAEVAAQPTTAERIAEDIDAAMGGATAAPVTPTTSTAAPVPPAIAVAPATNGNGAMVRAADEVLAPAPAEWERQLDPRSLNDAKRLALDMHASKMFAAYGSAPAVLAVVMAGRELGLPAMASLRSFHNIEGKITMSAAAMVAVILKSGLAEYFEPVSFSEVEATYETKRKGARGPVRLTYTIDQALKAGYGGAAKNGGAFKPDSAWFKTPRPMCVSRASSELARMVYGDILAGLYTPEELTDAREASRG